MNQSMFRTKIPQKKQLNHTKFNMILQNQSSNKYFKEIFGLKTKANIYRPHNHKVNSCQIQIAQMSSTNYIVANGPLMWKQPNCTTECDGQQKKSIKKKEVHNKDKINQYVHLTRVKRPKSNKYEGRVNYIKYQMAHNDIKKSLNTSKWKFKEFRNDNESLDGKLMTPHLTDFNQFRNQYLLQSKKNAQILKINTSEFFQKTDPPLPSAISRSVISQRQGKQQQQHQFKNYKTAKNYQQQLQREKKQVLEMRKEIYKNYAKPFKPPQNITAFSYMIYENINDLQPRISSAKTNEKDRVKKKFCNSFKILTSLNSRTCVQIASLTKIMTCLVILELANQHKIDITVEKIKIGHFQENINGTTANIQKGDNFTVEQLLYGLMLPSGNDASLALAVWGGRLLKKEQQQIYTKKKLYQQFLQEMNNKSLKIGLQKSYFANSHGLPNGENRSCAYDVAVLCQYAMKNKKFRQLVNCPEYQCCIMTEVSVKLGNQRYKNIAIMHKSNLQLNQYEQKNKQKEYTKIISEDEQDDNNSFTSFRQNSSQYIHRTIKWKNTHQLLHDRPNYYKGIKTGVTTTAGPCLASQLLYKNKQYTIIVLNCKNMKYRFKDTQILRKWITNQNNNQDQNSNIIKLCGSNKNNNTIIQIPNKNNHIFVDNNSNCAGSDHDRIIK